MALACGPRAPSGYRPPVEERYHVEAGHARSAELRSTEPAAVVVGTVREVDTVLHTPELFSSRRRSRLPNGRLLRPLELDGTAHEVLRAALDPLLSPTKVVDLTKMISYIAGELIDGIVDEHEIDFAARFSVPFPAQVLMTILGLPLDDLGWYLDLKEAIARPDRTLGKPLDDPEVVAYQSKMLDEAYHTFGEALDMREKDRTDDLLSDLLDIRIDGAPLDRQQLLDICLCLLIEGIDPVTAALDTIFAALAESSQLRAVVAANPRSALEELLRIATPVTYVARTAATDTSLGGRPISAGQQVYARLDSVNLDPDEFKDADSVCPHREVNRHFAFGAGAHRCFGSHLARMQLSVALKEWHARIPHYSVSRHVSLEFSPGVRTAERFPLRLERTR